MVTFIAIWSIWFASEILLARLMRSGTNDKKKQDKGSIRFIWVMIALAISLGVILSIKTRFYISSQPLISYIGIIIIVVGMIFRFISIWTLGRLFTVDVTIRDNHTIKKGGIYSIVRHPSYLGSLLSFVGFGISLNSWLSLFIITILMTIAFIYRIKIEERVLSDQFGTDYLDYKRNTYRLIPWIY